MAVISPKCTSPGQLALGDGTATWGRFVVMSSYLAAALMAIDSVIGLAIHDVYPEEPWAVAALRGNDLVTLAVAPVMTLAIARGQRSPRWLLVWLAGLFYGVYNFAYYAFGTNFSDVFLLHVATLALSIAALAAMVPRLDPAADIHRHAVRSDRVIAVFMVCVGAALVLAWGGFSLRFAMTGRLPHDVMPPAAIHLVYALDLSLMAPGFLSGGALLWQRRPSGYVLATAMNLFAAAYLVVLEVVGGFQARAGIEGKTWISPPAIGGAILCTIAAVELLRRTSPDSRIVRPPGQGPVPGRALVVPRRDHRLQPDQ